MKGLLALALLLAVAAGGRDALDDWNRYVEKNGLPLEELRLF